MKRGGHGYRQRTSLKQFVLDRDNRTCQLCGAPAQVVDHIIPFAISLDSTLGNLRALCRQCNLATRRHAFNAELPIEDWYTQIELELAGKPNHLFFVPLTQTFR